MPEAPRGTPGILPPAGAADTLPDTLPDAPAGSIADEGISFGQRLRQPRTLLSFALAAAIIALVVTRLNIDPAAVWRTIRAANPVFLLLAFAVYYSSFPVRALRWRTMLRNAGYDAAHGVPLPGLSGLTEMVVLSWFANTLLPAKLGDVYRGYLFQKATGVAFTRSVGTILAERLLDIFGLFSLLVVSGLLVFGGNLASQAALLAFGGVLCVGGFVGLFTVRWASGLLDRFVPARILVPYRKVEEGVFGSFGRWPVLGVCTAIIWVQEGLRVFLITQALSVPVGFAVALFVALAAALLTAVPFTPAGLGAVETGIIGVLQLVAVERNAAASVAVVDRVVGYWSILILGGVLYLVSRRK